MDTGIDTDMETGMNTGMNTGMDTGMDWHNIDEAEHSIHFLQTDWDSQTRLQT